MPDALQLSLLCAAETEAACAFALLLGRPVPATRSSLAAAAERSMPSRPSVPPLGRLLRAFHCVCVRDQHELLLVVVLLLEVESSVAFMEGSVVNLRCIGWLV